MNDPRKPQRAGLTRKLTGLPPVKEQHDALLDAGCFPIWEWSELIHAVNSSVTGDVIVAVDERVFKGAKMGEIIAEAMTDGPKVKAKKPGPKPKLAAANDDQWFAINWVYLNTKPKEGNAVALAQAWGIDADRFAIRNRSNREAKEAQAAIDEGKE